MHRSNSPPQRLTLKRKLRFNGVLKREGEIAEADFYCDELRDHLC
jgi:hypothetical protein